MESLHAIKSRIKAVGNVGQITKAMELVSATKMRKSQEVALRSRPYAFAALELLRNITSDSPLHSPYMITRPVASTLVVVVASDKGLTGSFNAQVLRAADVFFTDDSYAKEPGHVYHMLALGKKAATYAAKKKLILVRSFAEVGDYTTTDESGPIADIVGGGFMNGLWDRVVVISTYFRTTLKQETLVRQLLPMDLAEMRKIIDETVPEHGRFSENADRAAHHAAKKSKPHHDSDYLFEPSPEETFAALIPHLLAMQMYQIILEANASEHSARRVAMKTASDNADELARDLSLVYNKARQANITRELIEITSAQNVL